nr:Rv3654c family TadE-like protein [Arthrobacter sp. 260]
MRGTARPGAHGVQLVKGRAHRRRRGGEVGAGTVLTCGFALLLMSLIAAMVLLAQAGATASRAATAADLAALAAADASRGLIPGDPCTVAAETAAAQGATLQSCSRAGPGGTVVEVRTSARVDPAVHWFALIPDATGRARAGPPP